MPWNPSQYAAASKHALSFAAGGIAVAATWGLLSAPDATIITEGINDISNGLIQVAKGVAAIAGVAGSLWAAFRAAHNASPTEQMKSVVTNLSAPQVTQAAIAVEDPGGRAKLINAVSEMPEVKAVIATPAVAQSTPSDKVVSTVAAVRGV